VWSDTTDRHAVLVVSSLCACWPSQPVALPEWLVGPPWGVACHLLSR